jgi:hypothetical protein
MQKKGIKLELAAIDDVKALIKASMTFTGTFKTGENSINNIIEELNALKSDIADASKFYDTGVKTMYKFGSALEELGVEPRSNAVYNEAWTNLNEVQNRFTKLQTLIKSIK